MLKKLARKPVTIEDDASLAEAIRVMVENRSDVAIVCSEKERVLTVHVVARAVLKSEGRLANVLGQNTFSLAIEPNYVSENRKLAYLIKNLKKFLWSGNLVLVGRGGRITGYIKPEDIFKYFSENLICNDINSAFFHPGNCLLVYANRSVKSTLKSLLRKNTSYVFVYSRSKYKGSLSLLDLMEELVEEEILEKVSSGDDGYFFQASVSDLNPKIEATIDIEKMGKNDLVDILANHGHVAILKNRGLYRAIDDKNLLFYTINILAARSR